MINLLAPAEKNPPAQELTVAMCASAADSFFADEGTLKLSRLAGRVVVILVLGVDCGTCKHVARFLSELRYEYSPEVEFLGLCVASGCEEQLPQFSIDNELRLPLGHCPTRDLCPALGIPRATWLFYPTLIFLDRQQRLRGLFISGDSFFDQLEVNVRASLDRLLAEGVREPETAEVLS